jgi:hypothetical protein
MFHDFEHAHLAQRFAAPANLSLHENALVGGAGTFSDSFPVVLTFRPLCCGWNDRRRPFCAKPAGKPNDTPEPFRTNTHNHGAGERERISTRRGEAGFGRFKISRTRETTSTS